MMPNLHIIWNIMADYEALLDSVLEEDDITRDRILTKADKLAQEIKKDE